MVDFRRNCERQLEGGLEKTGGISSRLFQKLLLVQVFQRYQPNFSTLLRLKKSIRESAFRENIIVVVLTLNANFACELH